MRHCSNSSRVAALVSEEVVDVCWLEHSSEAGDYVLYFDPLDGSSNLDVNLSVGSIFSIIKIFKAIDSNNNRTTLYARYEQTCARYVIYGPSTALVVTTGNGVNGFTHQNGTGEFCLTYPDMKLTNDTYEFAINASRYQLWDEPIQKDYDACIAGKNGPDGKAHNMRWTASMVADIHRILIHGGVFLYPTDQANRSEGGDTV